MRIVLDTACFIAALRSQSGAAREVVRLILSGEITPLMDLKLGLEYRDVALRPEHLAASRLTLIDVIELIEEEAEFVAVNTKHRPLSVDPNDDMILDVAINGHADVIVTNNSKHFVTSGRRFEIKVLSPSEYLKVHPKGDQDGN